MQFDEMWSFVGKKEKNCDPSDPDDARQGDNWDHVAFDSEHRLVVEVVPGKRTAENVETLVETAKKRTGGRLMNLLTSDEYPAYETAILNAYGVEVTPPRTGKPGRPKTSFKAPPPGLNYATVHKTREKGRVVHVEERVVFGDPSAIKAALERSEVSNAINTAFIERHNGTERNRNSRKIRKTCGFSKDWDVHEFATYFTKYSYNFCWAVRTLGQRIGNRWQRRTPAMAAGLADRVWSLREWLTLPAVQRN
jgi:IS1 family transposase